MQERHLREDSVGCDEQADERHRNGRGDGSGDGEREQFEGTGRQTRSRPRDSPATGQLDDAGETNGRVARREFEVEDPTREYFLFMQVYYILQVLIFYSFQI